MTNIKIVVVTIIDFVLFLRCMFQPTNGPLESYYQILILEVQIILIYIGVFRAKAVMQLLRKANPQALLDRFHQRQDPM